MAPHMSGRMAGSSGRWQGAPASWAALIVAIPMALPIITILVLAAAGGREDWDRALSSALLPLTVNTILMCCGTGAFALLFGVTSSWLVSFYNFPGRKPLTWLAFLPIAMPGYIVSFVYVDFLNYAGPLQTWLRAAFGWTRPEDYSFPEVRSPGAAMLVLGLVLYPYIYLAGRAAFVRQPINQILVARTLGSRPWEIFLSVVLPQARPALVAGLVLVVMECLNDVGAMTFFGVRTYTIAIFSTWLDQGSLRGAAALALAMVAMAMVLVLLEKLARRQDMLPRVQRPDSAGAREVLRGWHRWAAMSAVTIPVVLGFFLPMLLLFGHSFRRLQSGRWTELALATQNTMILAVLAALIASVLAVILAQGKRRSSSTAIEAVSFLAVTGYALPGTVLAIGIIIPFSMADHFLNNIARSLSFNGPGLLLSGTIAALVFAYVARFLMSAASMVDAGFERIPFSIDHAASTLGRTPLASLISVHLPMLRPAIVAGALLVFVDAMKELPATLLLRPFDFETLATQVYTFASIGQIEEAALPATVIVLTGFIPVIVLMRSFRQANLRRS